MSQEAAWLIPAHRAGPTAPLPSQLAAKHRIPHECVWGLLLSLAWQVKHSKLLPLAGPLTSFFILVFATLYFFPVHPHFPQIKYIYCSEDCECLLAQRTFLQRWQGNYILFSYRPEQGHEERGLSQILIYFKVGLQSRLKKSLQLPLKYNKVGEARGPRPLAAASRTRTCR